MTGGARRQEAPELLLSYAVRALLARFIGKRSLQICVQYAVARCPLPPPRGECSPPQAEKGVAMHFRIEVIAVAEDGTECRQEVSTLTRTDTKLETIGLTLAE